MRRMPVVCLTLAAAFAAAHAGLSGEYTIKPQGGGDFASFGEACLAVRSQGVSGDITFLADSGDYSADWCELVDCETDTFTIAFRPAPGERIIFDGSRGWSFVLIDARIKVSGITFGPDCGLELLTCAGARIEGCTFDPTSMIDVEDSRDDTLWGNRLCWCNIENSTGIVVANNAFSCAGLSGSAVLLWARNNSAGLKVYYNTFYADGLDVCFENSSSNPGPADVRNNVYVIRGERGEATFWCGAPSSQELESDYNCYWPEPPATDVWAGAYYTLPEWQAFGYDTNSINADPLLVGPDDLHLRPGSPCIGRAVPIPGFEYDIDGDPRDPNQPDMGCDEFTGPGVEEGRRRPDRDARLTVTPNPAGPVAYVSAPPGVAAVTVYDALGRVVARRPLHSGRAELRGLNCGVYVVRSAAGLCCRFVVR